MVEQWLNRGRKDRLSTGYEVKKIFCGVVFFVYFCSLIPAGSRSIKY